jgi:hypothetical protein
VAIFPAFLLSYVDFQQSSLHMTKFFFSFAIQSSKFRGKCFLRDLFLGRVWVWVGPPTPPHKYKSKQITPPPQRVLIGFFVGVVCGCGWWGVDLFFGRGAVVIDFFGVGERL